MTVSASGAISVPSAPESSGGSSTSPTGIFQPCVSSRARALSDCSPSASRSRSGAIESSAASTTASRGSVRIPAWCGPSNGIRSAERVRRGLLGAGRGVAGGDGAERERRAGEEAAAVDLHGSIGGIAGG